MLASMPGRGTGEAYDVATTLFPLRRVGKAFLPMQLDVVGRRRTPVISRSEAGYFRQMALNHLLRENSEAAGVLSTAVQSSRSDGTWHTMGSDPRDVLAFLRGEVDDAAIVRCLAMLCATDFSRVQLERILPSPSSDWSGLPRAYMLAKLFAHRGYVRTDDGLKIDLEFPSSAVHMLGQGLYEGTYRELWRRLSIVGARPIGSRHNTLVQRSGPSFILGPVEGSRLLASLIFPASSSVSFERYLLLHGD
jgi:CRISPR-associated protein Csx17